MSLPSTPKILVIRRDNIGDLVCTTPLISALRRRFPEAEAAWVLVREVEDPDRVTALLFGGGTGSD